MVEQLRYISATTSLGAAHNAATVTTQGLFELRGLPKLLAILLRKPTSEWRKIDTQI